MPSSCSMLVKSDVTSAILRQVWEELKELEEVFAVPDVRGECFQKKLYEMGDIV